MHEQASRGHEVSYFFSGRYYPWLRRPRLRRWQLGPAQMLEVVGSPCVVTSTRPSGRVIRRSSVIHSRCRPSGRCVNTEIA